MKNQKKIEQIVKVDWIDAMSRTTWENKEGVDEFVNEVIVHSSVGFFYVKTKDYFVIAECKDSIGNWVNIQKIPIKTIKKITYYVEK